MKPFRLLCYMFLLAFLDLTMHSIPIILKFLTHRSIICINYFIQSQFVNRKQRILHGQGASNINCSTVVFNFDVHWLS